MCWLLISKDVRRSPQKLGRHGTGIEWGGLGRLKDPCEVQAGRARGRVTIQATGSFAGRSQRPQAMSLGVERGSLLPAAPSASRTVVGMSTAWQRPQEVKG